MNGSQMYENTIHIAVVVNAQPCSGKPIFASDQLSAPAWLRISRQA